MTFFNRKEEVIDIQLTQYGKYLLSKGKFKPVYYAFSDDDIIYDTSYGGEPKEFSQEPFNRINSVPRIKTIYNVTSIEDSVKELNEQNLRVLTDMNENKKPSYLKSTNQETRTPIEDIYGIDNIENLSMQVDYRTIIKNILGTSELGNKNYPTWSVRSLTTKINEPYISRDIDNKKVVNSIPLKVSSSSDLPYEKKYQLEFRPRWVVFNASQAQETNTDGDTGFGDIVTLGGNRQAISLEKPDTILDVKENNVFSTRENFEVEVFEIVDLQEKNSKYLKKLFFTEGMDDVSMIPPECRVETFLELNFDLGVAITDDMEADGSKYNRALLQNKLADFFNSQNSENITIFGGPNGTLGSNPILNLDNLENQGRSNSYPNTNNAGNPSIVNRETVNRNSIGESLYQFDRDQNDSGECE